MELGHSQPTESSPSASRLQDALIAEGKGRQQFEDKVADIRQQFVAQLRQSTSAEVIHSPSTLDSSNSDDCAVLLFNQTKPHSS